MKHRVHVGIMMLFVMSACLVHAQIPRTLFYQGVLSDSTGAAKPDGPYLFTFRLYEASSGGSAVGTQQQTLQVKRGLFSTVFDQLLNGLTIDHPFWFTVQVQNEAELSPRIPFTSVPYSISSISADTARYALTVPSNTGWSLSGNAGTVSGTNFIGTTDDIPFTIRVNNQRGGQISSTGPTFLGYQAGNSNASVSNMGIGYRALFSNTTGSANTASGYQALRSNTTGDYNTASGTSALFSNTTGTHNTASGVQALASNTTGNDNTASGYQALNSNTTGTGNVAVGYAAGSTCDNGNTNVFLGAFADMNGAGFSNGVAIGYFATVTATSQARIGSASTTSIGGYANWTNISDGRYKKNVKEDVKGLAFIMKLRPVTYNLDVSGISAKLNESRGGEMIAQMKTAMAEKERMVQSGFIAQEVEQAAKELGYDFSGVDAPKNDKDLYGLRYAEFTVPLVKAVQELSKENKELTARVAALETMVKSLATQR